MKNFDQRRRFILNWLTQHAGGVDVLNADFADAYIKANEAKFQPTNIGAFRVPQIGTDLSRMAKEGSLERSRIGIQGMGGQGFPTWVWSYRLSKHL